MNGTSATTSTATATAGNSEKNNLYDNYVYKLEKILKSNLDSIPSPSPSMKIQIMGGKFA